MTFGRLFLLKYGPSFLYLLCLSCNEHLCLLLLSHILIGIILKLADVCQHKSLLWILQHLVHPHAFYFIAQHWVNVIIFFILFFCVAVKYLFVSFGSCIFLIYFFHDRKVNLTSIFLWHIVIAVDSDLRLISIIGASDVKLTVEHCHSTIIQLLLPQLLIIVFGSITALHELEILKSR